uniref:angiogenic factor with G patch and FHA domains 1 isoform X1 n=1 Tax=Vespula vulgaris TaxID=7454 RepID=UPI00223A8F9C|nr:angiogenic factor with G patch and FHA domains 1 isoform X1 [Vespula vulgaris]
MTEHGIQSESDEGEIKSDFGENLDEELQSLPHALQLIRKMREHIKWQRKKIKKLRNKLQEQKNRMRNKSFIEYGTQTDPLECENKYLIQNWDLSNNKKSNSLIEQVKQVAESALLQTGFVYEETSGLYYDYNTGYYYDAKQGLYYDGNNGTYYYYDESSKTYKFHSHAHTVVNNIAHSQETKKEKKSDGKKANKDTVKKRKLAQDGESLKEDEPEEGECSDSDSEQSSYNVTPELSTNSETENEEEQDIAKTYPPCMRIIVKETNLPKLKVGSLFLVAYTGGSMGKEGDHSVIIPDINVSKHHARFLYNETTNSYWIVDSGSRNGTYLNGKRLSVAKQESESYEIIHGSIIQVGGTKLLCHIHNGNETCGHCEPGLVQHNVNTEENVFSRRNLHKQELRRLKTKFGVEKDNVASASQLASGYRDRAQARRQCVGSSNHHAKTEQSSIDTSITKDNRGFKLLSKMGWSEGRSLGKDGDGRTEPRATTALGSDRRRRRTHRRRCKRAKFRTQYAVSAHGSPHSTCQDSYIKQSKQERLWCDRIGLSYGRIGFKR